MAHRPRGERRAVTRQIEIVPSILSADLTRLGEQVREAVEAGADRSAWAQASSASPSGHTRILLSKGVVTGIVANFAQKM